MQLNTELTGILNELGDAIPNDYVKEKIKSREPLIFQFKTPNFFYKKNRVFFGEGDTAQEITDLFKESDIKQVKACLAKAYFNYFVHYNTQFCSKYYVVVYEPKVGSSSKILVKDSTESNSL
jgi:hypothetical protein